MAVEVLKSRGVAEDRILFINLIASPEGVTNFATRFPKLRIVTAFVDQGLDERKLVFIIRGAFALLIIRQLHCPGPWGFWRQVLHTLAFYQPIFRLLGRLGPTWRGCVARASLEEAEHVIAFYKDHCLPEIVGLVISHGPFG